MNLHFFLGNVCVRLFPYTNAQSCLIYCFLVPHCVLICISVRQKALAIFSFKFILPHFIIYGLFLLALINWISWKLIVEKWNFYHVLNWCWWHISDAHKSSLTFSSVEFSHSVMSDSLWPHESQHARPPCPSSAPGVHPNSCASSRWCHPAISSSVIPFSSCPQSLPASESFPMS